MDYYAIELHAHTNHSDGGFTTEELLGSAQNFGYDILTITDHNTVAPYEEWKNNRHWSGDMLVIPGIEWTTYLGHMLVIGSKQMIDWRKADRDTIDSRISEIKGSGGIVGIAHPFSIGSPICTGCRWEFQVKDYDNVDFIELWNRVNPDESFRSRLAYEMWTDLLKKGHRISCSAGRDWRRIESEMDNTALTYIGLQELTEDGVKESLENGNFYITLGPRLQMQIEQNGRIHHLGQELQVGVAQLHVSLESILQEKLQNFGFKGERLVVIQNEVVIKEIELKENQSREVPLTLHPGYVRLELYGEAKGEKDRLLVISNPFYVV